MTTMKSPSENALETTVHQIITKRIKTFQHLQFCFCNPVKTARARAINNAKTPIFKTQPYLGVMNFTPHQILQILSKPKLKRRAKLYYTFGVSIGNILLIENPLEFIKSLGILVEELDMHIEISNGNSVKRYFTKMLNPTDNTSDFPDQTEPKSYTYLELLNFPFEYDLVVVFDSFCTMAISCYQKLEELVSLPSFSQQVETFERIDNRFRLIIQTVLKEADENFRSIISSEFQSIDTLRKPKNEPNVQMNIPDHS
ncbi:hypothetical protein BB559_005582 [Furculomyces boomerangus]|uniref:Uncharacterized protein n=2 Tax=Harpellales TaxID=61421 RepID=A0A2T9Y7S0_9FUNG|nr:hypothetical protein BB559_005582 [Furculomyces boomerangus]PVZ98152.1 hypothetical protein BB558_005850 [Smittium angustum]